MRLDLRIADQRLRRVAVSAVAAALAKGATVLNIAVSVPVVMKSLGPSGFGIWATITGTVAMLGFSDLGLGLGLLNEVSHSLGIGDVKRARRAISTTTVLLAIVAAVFCSLALVCVNAVVPAVVGGHTGSPASRLGVTIATCALIFFGALPFNVVQHVQNGLQMGYRTSAWQAGGVLLSLVALVVAARNGAGLEVLAAVVLGGPAVATIANFAYWFGIARPDLRPSLREFDSSVVGPLLRQGLTFFVLQALAQIIYSTDNLFVVALAGPVGVAQYNVCARLFVIPTVLLSLFSGPLWPAFGDAFARKDLRWLHRTVKSSVAAALVIATCVSVGLLIIARPVVLLWTRGSITPMLPLLVALAIFSVCDSVRVPISSFLGGTGMLRVQVVIMIAFATSSVVAKVCLGRSFGLMGVAWGGALAACCAFAIPSLLYCRSVLKRMRSDAARDADHLSDGPCDSDCGA